MRILSVVLCLLTFAACSKEQDIQSQSLEIQQEWHYISYFGAEGPQCNYEREDKIYTFGSTTIQVVNNYFDDDICNITFLEEGVYSYEIKSIDGTDYLYIQDTEYGRLTINEDGMLLESSITSLDVEIADAPSFRFVL